MSEAHVVAILLYALASLLATFGTFYGIHRLGGDFAFQSIGGDLGRMAIASVVAAGLLGGILSLPMAGHAWSLYLLLVFVHSVLLRTLFFLRIGQKEAGAAALFSLGVFLLLVAMLLGWGQSGEPPPALDAPPATRDELPEP